jgi:hypothetical protein
MKSIRKRIALPIHRSVLGSLLLLSFGLRALTPVGYMPGSIADGSLYVLCPGSTPGASYFLDLDHSGHASGHHHEQGDSDQSDTAPWESCTFAAAFTASAPAPELFSTDYPANLAFASELLRTPIFPTVIQVVRARGPPIAAS